MSGRVVFAMFSTWVTPTVQVERGQIWDPEDAVVKSHPDWFTDDPTEFMQHSDMYTATKEGGTLPEKKIARTAPTVEATTSVPGDKRTVNPRVDK